VEKEKKSMKIVAVISGGMDSVTLLYRLKKEGHKLKAISFDYGQRHKKELEAAKATCEKLNIEHSIIDITSITKFISNSSLTGNINVPEGHYEAKSMKQTVVPSRNTIMLSIANGYAVNIDYDAVATAVHAGDHFIYPDCRPLFIEKITGLFRVNNFKKILVHTPYLYFTKADILKDGLRLNVDYSLTWTCYNGREKSCGKCGSCQERLEAFKLNNEIDPLEYE
jgi:7-cyano-7-deazaguanine synthase